jgi:hypothetical protein
VILWKEFLPTSFLCYVKKQVSNVFIEKEVSNTIAPFLHVSAIICLFFSLLCASEDILISDSRLTIIPLSLIKLYVFSPPESKNI